MDDTVFKAKYQKYKYKVKMWEKQFKEKCGRIPSKHDIREAPVNIRDSYRMYYKMKTSYLEETLSEALEDDAFDLSLLESSSQSLSSSLVGMQTPDVTLLTSDESAILANHSSFSLSSSVDTTAGTSQSLIKETNASNYESSLTEFEADNSSDLNEKAWGTELNRSNSHPDGRHDDSKSKNAMRSGASLRKSMSDKLFRNASFSTRNPRKSLSRNGLTAIGSQSSIGSMSNSQRETLPDLETILSQKSMQMRDNEMNASQETIVDHVVALGAKTHSNLINSIDHEWLNRCNQNNNLNASDNDNLPTTSSPATANQTYGLSNINTNALQTLEAKLRAIQVNPNQCAAADDDDDEEIANSEDESTNNINKREIQSIRKSLSKRRHSEMDKLPKTTAIAPIIETKSSEVAVDSESDSDNTGQTTERKLMAGKRKIARKTTRSMPKVDNQRRIKTRTSTKRYTEPTLEGISDEELNEDPFAGDDSDADPTFDGNSEKKKTKTRKSSDSDDESSEPVATTKAKTKKVKVTKVKPTKPSTRSAGRTQVTKKPSIKPNPSRKVRQVPPTRKKADVQETNEELPVDESPDDYLMEFGIDNVKSVPRVAVDELTKNSKRFSEYLHQSAAQQVENEASATMMGAMKKKAATASSSNKPLSTKNSIAKEKLEKRVASGTLNENFVQINLRKKVFVRGKKTINMTRYKKSKWRERKASALIGPEMDMRGCDGGLLICFQCGQTGHFAQNCKVKSDRLLPLSADVEESPFMTLQEVEEISKQKLAIAHAGREIPKTDNPTWKNDENATAASASKSDDELVSFDDVVDDPPEPPPQPSTPAYIGHQIPEDFLKKAGLLNEDGDRDSEVGPVYRIKDDGSLPDTPNEVFDALRQFGHTEFRSGQEQAVMRILSGQSTLVTLSTGSGKSLCYQLPAYLYSKKMKCITLVISPLVSLMEDQVHGVPDFLNAQCLHTNQSKVKRDAIMMEIKAGNVHVLLISPEAIVAGEKSTGFGSILRDLPPIAFVCIDEAHCVSQWSHNFRPSYLMVCRVLHEKLKVKTVLGLTATATLTSRQSIVRHLMVPDGLDGVISDIPLPDNLLLTISSDENRDAALVRLLQTERFAEFNSIIVYCSRRDECERVAKKLRTYFQESIAQELNKLKASGKRKRTLKTTIEPYHAGLGASRRRTIQNAFMRGDLKIVVATIAFGMGINKADIRAVIHYNMPMNFESYVQEVGRAGRDGEPAHCHLFLDPKGQDKLELRRHIYANSIDRHVIRKLLQKIFLPCACKRSNEQKSDDTTGALQSDLEAVQSISWEESFDDIGKHEKQRNCPGHEVCFSIDETISELDIPEENIATLLCYLELHEQRYIKTLSKAYTRCKVFSYGGSKALRAAATACPPLAMAIALDLNKGISHETSTFIEFPVIDVASAIGWNSGVVKYQLKNLEWTNGKRSTISVEFLDLGFRVLAPGDLSDDELDSTLDLLYSRVQGQERNQRAQLENVFRGLTSVAVTTCQIAAQAEYNDERSESLKKIIRNYFQSNEKTVKDFVDDDPTDQNATADAYIISDIRTMISRYPENNFTGRALARIFHGVHSPVYPAVIWARCKHWRAHLKTDFNHIVKMANMEILKSRS